MFIHKLFIQLLHQFAIFVSSVLTFDIDTLCCVNQSYENEEFAREKLLVVNKRDSFFHATIKMKEKLHFYREIHTHNRVQERYYTAI